MGKPIWITHGKTTPFYARKSFEIQSEVRQATAWVCGLGQFIFYLNGRKVSDHELDPGWTDYDRIIEYVTFDVTKYLKEGQYYAEEVRRFVVNQLGEDSIYLGGLSIRTSLDPKLQNYAVAALQNGLIESDRKHGYRGPVEHVSGKGRDALKKYEHEYTPKNWTYALVEKVSDQKADIYLLDGSQGSIPLSEMLWARKALDKGRISVIEVKKASEDRKSVV